MLGSWQHQHTLMLPPQGVQLMSATPSRGLSAFGLRFWVLLSVAPWGLLFDWAAVFLARLSIARQAVGFSGAFLRKQQAGNS